MRKFRVHITLAMAGWLVPLAACAGVVDAALRAGGAPPGEAWLPLCCVGVLLSPLLLCLRRGQG